MANSWRSWTRCFEPGFLKAATVGRSSAPRHKVGAARGKCVLDDGLEAILDQIDECDSLVLGSPVNFGDITAITKRFQERLISYTYWQWERKGSPSFRGKAKNKQAMLASSCAAPSLVGRLMYKSLSSLKKTVTLLGAKVVGSLFIGLIAEKEQTLPEWAVRQSRKLGRKLAS